MEIIRAEKSDLKMILELQYSAYQSEAKLLNNFEIPPLKQTLCEVEQEFVKGVFLKATDENGNIIGSIRAHINENTTFVNKVIVQPEKQGQGIGTKLLLMIEQECVTGRYELFTSDKSVRNIKLYERIGYVKYRDQKISDNLTLIFMEKFIQELT